MDPVSRGEYLVYGLFAYMWDVVSGGYTPWGESRRFRVEEQITITGRVV